jgi:hypothetical protein
MQLFVSLFYEFSITFSSNNLNKVIKATKHENLPYILLIDNDSGKSRNTGVEAAIKLIEENQDCQIHPILFDLDCDANDFIIRNGADAFVVKLINIIGKDKPTISLFRKHYHE